MFILPCRSASYSYRGSEVIVVAKGVVTQDNGSSNRKKALRETPGFEYGRRRASGSHKHGLGTISPWRMRIAREMRSPAKPYAPTWGPSVHSSWLFRNWHQSTCRITRVWCHSMFVCIILSLEVIWPYFLHARCLFEHPKSSSYSRGPQ